MQEVQSKGRSGRTGMLVLAAVAALGVVSADTQIRRRDPAPKPAATITHEGTGVPSNWILGAEEQIAASEYHPSRQTGASLSDLGSAWQAPNRAQGFRTYFTEAGIRVVPRTDETLDWEWSLALVSWGRAGAHSPAGPAKPRVDAGRIDYDRDKIAEWYVNDRRGLEHGFRLAAPPPKVSKPRGARCASCVHVDLALGGTLQPGVASDGQAIDFTTGSGQRVLRYGALVVRDAVGRELRAWMEGFSGPGTLSGIRIVFDDAAAEYPVTIDSLATSYAWQVESNQAGAALGVSVATAGDVNGDGYSDIIVGAYLYDNGTANEGVAFVYMGSPAGPLPDPAWTADGIQSSAYFGYSVASAGDVNGDGYADVVVGAYRYGASDVGRARVYHGSASGLSASPSWSVDGDQASSLFGVSVATAGDVNADGYADVIVGALLYDNGQTDEGRAYVYHGGTGGLSTTPAWIKDGDRDLAEFGASVATAGDTNGDGYSDVIVGADMYGSTQAGAAFVYRGGPSGLGSSPAPALSSTVAGALFGISVSTAGDVNGDGYADVIVGAYHHTNGQTEEGKVYVYHGSASGIGTTPGWTIESDEAGAQLGVSVATAGDVNGDGYADVVVGARLADTLTTDSGLAHVFLGSASGLATSAAWSGIGDLDGNGQLGTSVATAGDVNGDGYSDVIVGAPLYDSSGTESDEGKAYVYLGSGSGLTASPTWVEESDQGDSDFASSVATAGDVNGDGYSDVIIGARYYDGAGRAFLYLGSPAGLSADPAWSKLGGSNTDYFGASVSTAGDVNGDGYSDVIVGASFAQGADLYAGRAYVYLGSVSGLSSTHAWTTQGTSFFMNLGESVATAGDVNGDGFSDVIVGAGGSHAQAPSAGKAFVYLGSAQGLGTVAAWVGEGSQTGEGFGSSAASAGDVNGDGYSDVIVGASGHDSGQGRALVFLGSATGLSSSPAWTVESTHDDTSYGDSVASAGDVNGDGYSDVIIGAWRYGPDSEGLAEVWLGSASGLASSPAWSVVGSAAADTFGSSVATAGDVDGDGYSDVVVGGYYNDQAWVYRGSASGLGVGPSWTADETFWFGWSVGSAGDVNGDGFSDIIVGQHDYSDTSGGDLNRAYVYHGGGSGLDRIPRQARTDGTTPVALLGKSDAETALRLREMGRTAAGRGNVRLEWEAKPLGTPFDGTGLGRSTLRDTGAPFPRGSFTIFNEPVTGLAEGTFYHWRARITSPDPFFPHSPWMSLAGNNVTETKLRTAGCVDRDGDGTGDIDDPSCATQGYDCNDRDTTIWGTPGTTGTLVFTSKTVMSWQPPANPGGPVSSLLYDTLRSGVRSNFVLADCVESDDGPNTTATDLLLPSAGQVFYYLNRAQNACPVGIGSLGARSAGAERVGRGCP